MSVGGSDQRAGCPQLPTLLFFHRMSKAEGETVVSGRIPNNLVTPYVGLQTDLKLPAKIKKTGKIVETGS